MRRLCNRSRPDPSILALLLVASLAGTALLTAQPAAPARAVFTAEELMADVTALAAPDMQGRATATPGGAKAREWILERFRRAKLEPLGKDFQLPFSFERRSSGSTQGVKTEGVNLAGVCKGTGAKDKGALIITGHYDHLGMLNGAIIVFSDDLIKTLRKKKSLCAICSFNVLHV